MSEGQAAFLSSVLIPALVAAVVTLFVEYLAKPHLEVRKERVLHRHRCAQELREAFSKLSFEVGRFQARENTADLGRPRLAEVADYAQRSTSRLGRD